MKKIPSTTRLSLRTAAPLSGPRSLLQPMTALCALILTSTISPAQTWLPTPPGSPDSIWNNPLNWAPANVPDAAGETAIFALSNKLTPTIVAPITINGITFNAGAPGYTIINNTGAGFVGAGIVNNSAVVQTFTNNGAFDFFNAASAGHGASIVFNNGGALTSMNFFDTSTAGSSTINVTNATALINFFDSATAGAATINNNGASGAFPGSTISFFATSNAGTATINNIGANTLAFFGANSSASTATITNGGAGSGTVFALDATAGDATITNAGSTSFIEFNQQASAGTSLLLNNGPNTGINFFDTSTAATAALTNNSPTSLINFFDATTAGTSTITNAGSDPVQGSAVSFFGTATASDSTITNSGQNTTTFFGANSTAATAAITNSGTGSSLVFSQNANAGTAAITSSGTASRVEFNDATSASNSTILLSGPLSSGSFFDTSTADNSVITLTDPDALLNFFDTATAATATIFNNGGGAFPGSNVGFFNSSTADRATIFNNGANTQTLFSDNSTAAAATITNTGAGSSTAFAASASGGTARLINANPTAFIDISQLTIPGTTVGSVEGNGFLNLGSKRLTTGLNNRDTTFSGIIRDGGLGGGVGGALVKVGSGTFTLSGLNTFTGGAFLRDGTIVVASPRALGAGNVTVSGGVLRAGGPTRNINVAGDYTQTGGELSLRIGGSGDGQYDRLAVGGRANLGGRLRVVPEEGFRRERGDRFTLLTTGDGVSGRFADFRNELERDFVLQLELIYEPNRVILGVVQGNFLPFARTPNQRAVARALDASLDRSLFDDGANLIDFLNTLRGANIPAALDLIAPEELGAIFEITRSSAKIQALTVNRRLDEIHALVWAPSPDGVYEQGGDGKTHKEAKEIKEVTPQQQPLPRLGVFAQANGEYLEVGSTFNARGFDIESGGATIGADYRFSDHFAAGLLVNYTRTRADLTGPGSIDADALRAGLYASVFGGGFYANTYVAGGLNTYDTRRDGLGGRTRGDTDGAEFNAMITAGYDAKIGHLTIGPIASYHYTYSKYDGFDEKGSLAPLHIESQSGESSRTNLGFRATHEWFFGRVVFTPELRASWQHEFGNVTYPTTSRFDFGGPSFTVQSAEVGRDSLVVGAGFSLQFSERCAAYAYYDGELFRDNFEAHNGIVGLRVSF